MNQTPEPPEHVAEVDVSLKAASRAANNRKCQQHLPSVCLCARCCRSCLPGVMPSLWIRSFRVFVLKAPVTCLILSVTGQGEVGGLRGWKDFHSPAASSMRRHLSYSKFSPLAVPHTLVHQRGVSCLAGEFGSKKGAPRAQPLGSGPRSHPPRERAAYFLVPSDVGAALTALIQLCQ